MENPTILLVTQDPSDKEFFRSFSHQSQYEIKLEDNIKNALHALSNEHFHVFRLILIQCSPNFNLDGLELARHIRKQEEISKKRIPIIGLIDLTQPIPKSSLKNAGFDSVVFKPFHAQHMDHIILQWVIMSFTEEFLGEVFIPD